LLAELGDISRSDDEAAIVQYAGLTWKSDQSADYKAEDTDAAYFVHECGAGG
jgi:hypothetical protein